MNKKSKFRAGLNFGIGMTVFFILQNLLTENNQTTNQIIKSVVAGVIAGALSGVLFGWLTGLLANSKFITRTTKIETEPDENILFETRANHFKGIEAVGGKLYLTDKRLIFKSHKLNIQSHQLSIKLMDIEKVSRYKTAGILNNGLSITTIKGTTEKFIVEQAGDWLKYLTQKNGLQPKALQNAD